MKEFEGSKCITEHTLNDANAMFVLIFNAYIPLNKFPMDLPSTHVWAHIDLEIYGLYYHCLQLDTILIDV